ncbi:MAG: carboxypeptidase-like regulatory domain-containing protein, partial [Gemmatimonadota bacterium]
MSVHPDGFDHDVVIRFNERISEKMGQIRNIDDAVLVSPHTGRVKIHRGRSSLKIHEDGGWKPGYVYHIYVRPVLQDLFGNKLQEPIDLIFSTGPAIQNTTLGGIVENRIDGKPVPDALIDATQRGSKATYVAMSDTAGFFALRYVPAGAYDVVAFQDRDANGKLDFPEPVDTAVATLAVNDTAVVTLPLLPGDTTPARLIRAEAKDSVTVTLSFDDYLDPDRPVDGSVAFFLLPDSTPAGGGEMMHPFELEARRAAEKAAADSAARAAAADSLARAAADSARRAGADTAAPAMRQLAPDTLPGNLLARGARRDTAGQETARQDTAARDTAAPLPSRDVSVVPTKPLLPDTVYVVVVHGITNINDLPGGGGSAHFRTPVPDTAKADSLATADSTRKALPSTVPPVRAVRPWLLRVLGGGRGP